jgi:hypothetical protein
MSDDSKPSHSTGPKAFDIFTPNKRQAQSSSRPIIISNKPEQEDPMMIKEAATPDTTDVSPSKEMPDTAPETDTEATEATTAPEADTIPDEMPASDNTDEETNTPDDPPAVGADDDDKTPEADTAGQSPSPEKAEDALPKEAQPGSPVPPSESKDEPTDEDLSWVSANTGSAATQAPIISIHKSSSKGKALKWVLGIVIGIVLIAVITDIALDAGWWTPSFSVPHTHFLKK